MVSPKRGNKSGDHFMVVVNRQPDLGDVSNCSGSDRPFVDDRQRSWFFKFKQRKVMAFGESLVDECVSSCSRVY